MEALEILKKLTDNGYEAYIVGGFVRDYLLDINTVDIDITTNANSETVSKIFGSNNIKYGCVSFKWKQYHVEVTTYREEISYQNRHPKKYYFTSDIRKDLMRRDFTVNAICLDQHGNIFDPLKGVGDLKSKELKVIGDVKKKFTDDPLRMLRAIRFALSYNFKIEKSALDFIEQNTSLIKNLSYFRKKEELTKIMLNKNAMVCHEKIKKLMNILEIIYPNSYKYTDNYLACWSQLKFSNNYPFSKKELDQMRKIREIVCIGDIDNYTLLDYGLEAVLNAAPLLDYNTDKIYEMYESIKLKNKNDLKIDGFKIKELIKLNDNHQIEEIKKDLIINVLSGNLSNSEESLVKYIIEKWK